MINTLITIAIVLLGLNVLRFLWGNVTLFKMINNKTTNKGKVIILLLINLTESIMIAIGYYLLIINYYKP